MLEEVITFKNKLSIFAQDFERETLFHFPSLLKHRQQNNSSIDKHHFKTIILNMGEALAFVKNPLNAMITELKFSRFDIDISGYEIQLLDLKNKEIWRSKFERLCVELEIMEKKKM